MKDLSCVGEATLLGFWLETFQWFLKARLETLEKFGKGHL